MPIIERCRSWPCGLQVSTATATHPTQGAPWGALSSPLPSAAHPSWRLWGERATGQTRDAQPGGGRVWARPRLSGGLGAFFSGVQLRGPALNVSHQAPWNVSPSFLTGAWGSHFGGTVTEHINSPALQTDALRQQTGWEGPGPGQTLFPWLLIFLVCGCLTTAVKTAYKLGVRL